MLHWLNQNAGAMQAIGTVAVAVLTCVLVRVTSRYTSITEKALRLSREQFEKQWTPDLQIVVCNDKGGKAPLRMVNMAYPAALVTHLNLRFDKGVAAKDRKHSFVHHVTSDRVEERDIASLIEGSAKELYPGELNTGEGKHWQKPIRISVTYKCAGMEGTSSSVECGITMINAWLVEIDCQTRGGGHRF